MTPRPARRALLAVPVLVLASACGGPSSGGTIPGDRDETCADLVVIGARGSTQDPDLNRGVGTEVRRTTDRLARLLARRDDTSLDVEAIRYDASQAATLDAYMRNVAEGSRMMDRRLRVLERRCHGSRFALIGFSQGAQVVHGTATTMSASTASRVDLVAMIADPLTNPSDRIAHWSYGGRPATGGGRLGAGPPIDADLRDVAISLCVDGDEICNDRGAPGGPPSDTHKRFYESPQHAQQTAEQLDTVLRTGGR